MFAGRTPEKDKNLNREEKTAAVAEIAEQIEGSEAIFAIDYRGISVPQAAELRSKLRETDSSFRVVKNRLTKLAADKAKREDLKDLLEGPTALTFVRGDTAAAAKTITTFNREHDVLTFKGGFMADTTLDEERFTAIAKLPSRDVLNGQFAGVVASPLTGLVRGLGSMIQGLALQLGQIAEQGLVTGEAPAAEPEPAPADEAPAAEGESGTPGSEAEDVPVDGEAGSPSEEASSSDSSPTSEDGEAPDASEEQAEAPSDEPSETPAAEAESGTPGGEAEDVPADSENASPGEEPSVSDSSETSPGDEAPQASESENNEEE